LTSCNWLPQHSELRLPAMAQSHHMVAEISQRLVFLSKLQKTSTDHLRG
jgi:hypothetical protein